MLSKPNKKKAKKGFRRPFFIAPKVLENYPPMPFK
jgi:hypothetical protein